MHYENSTISLENANPKLAINPFKALIAPRPIGWISTLDQNGNVNLAPYSYFQAVADNPDIVFFSAAPELIEEAGQIRFGEKRKHSEQNALASGEFVCNLVNFDLREQMNATSANFPKGISEAEKANLDLSPSKHIKTPRVASSPAALECVVVDSHPVKHRGGNHLFHLVFGEVVGIYINDKFVGEQKVDTKAMRLVTRMGYDEYTVTEKSFSMTRPDFDPMKNNMLKPGHIK